MRILALDYGTRRIGVAVSDETRTIAQPREFIPAEPKPAALARLKEIVREQAVERIIVGMPRNMDGTYGPAAEKVMEYVAELQRENLPPVETLDERLTTVSAQRVLIQGKVRRSRRKTKIDQTAAAILLQSYLDGLQR